MLTYDITSAQFTTWEEDTALATIWELAQEFGLAVAETTLVPKKGSVRYLAHPQYLGFLDVMVWPWREAVWIDIHDNRRIGKRP
ncbi:MAG: hypothetical protein C7B46_18755 [Sulfobacillus benefaciens]|uniref:Uncharacterized protein n=1 Tax=Sulfobacillus benefaciens TaxID=453960 RepID=A0A2T2X3J1_9FIRM|nr:MAG: hypothetical protein C7B46_18755 [Sulfobacillus benefaciens]